MNSSIDKELVNSDVVLQKLYYVDQLGLDTIVTRHPGHAQLMLYHFGKGVMNKAQYTYNW